MSIFTFVARIAGAVERKASAKAGPAPKERFAPVPETEALFAWVKAYEGPNKVVASIGAQAKRTNAMTAGQITFVRNQKAISDSVVRAPAKPKAAPRRRAAAAK